MSQALKCPGVGRDKDCISALQFYFSRPVTDYEMRFLHDVMKRAAACVPTPCPYCGGAENNCNFNLKTETCSEMDRITAEKTTRT